MFQHAGHQPFGKDFDLIGRFALLPELLEPDARFAVNVVLKQDLQRSLARLVARSHNCYFVRLRTRPVLAPFFPAASPAGDTPSALRIIRITVAISIADFAASPPRLNFVGSARSMACATVSVVSTPKMIGTSASRAA